MESKTDPRGKVWSYRYTASGDLAEQSDPVGLVTKIDYVPVRFAFAPDRMPEGRRGGPGAAASARHPPLEHPRAPGPPLIFAGARGLSSCRVPLERGRVSGLSGSFIGRCGR
ncbi:RHS repeat domain-containing protein [Nonomuraea sp. NPDC050691]|uniref:RHS repeat domain-containing protein n=1 Tax=Nonomuraea sp. NPDC050691 TaxID=3155661 RepID=UPI0033C9DE4C